MITGEDQDKIWPLLLEGIDILKNGIGGPLIPVFVNSLLCRDDLDEFSERSGEDVPPYLDVAMKGDRFILSQGIDAPDIRMEAIGKGEINDPVDGAKGYGRFGTVPG
jgi:hypothetical protein